MSALNEQPQQKGSELVKKPLLERIFNIFSRREFTNPYSKDLDYFFNVAVKKDPEQEILFQEYSDYKDLRNEYIKLHRDADGDVEKFEVVNRAKYNKKKEELQLV